MESTTVASRGCLTGAVICRLCMARQSEFVNVSSSINGITFQDIIQELISVEVALGDGLPDTLCCVCSRKLIDFREFKKMCITSVAELRQKSLDRSLKEGEESCREEDIGPDRLQDDGGNWVPLQMGNLILVKEEPDQSDAESCSGEGVLMDEPNERFDSDEEHHSNPDILPSGNERMLPNISFEMPKTMPVKFKKKFLSSCGSHSQVLGKELTKQSTGAESITVDQVKKNTVDSDIFHGVATSRKINEAEVLKIHKNHPCVASVDNSLKCKTCGKKFATKRTLMQHVIIHSDLKPFVCETCGKRFNQKGNLLTHMGIHLDVRPFQCDICGRGYFSKGDIKKHLVVHSGLKPFKCKMCGKGFHLYCNMLSHLSVHSDLRPYSCDVCGKTFKIKGDLSKHLVIHSNLRPFECEVCGKRFKSKAGLKNHLPIHSDLKRFNCDTCGKGYNRRIDLANHSVVHTGLRPFKCEVCGRGFNWKNMLKKHACLPPV